MKTLTIGNQKGGVGKSTLAINLAVYAAEILGLRTLLVDFDEGDIAEVFDDVPYEKQSAFFQSSAFFNGDCENKELRKVGNNLWLVSADVEMLDIDDLDMDIIENPKKELARFNDDFDLCIIDTPPNLQRRMLGALVASDFIVSPFVLGLFPISRIPKFQNAISAIRNDYNSELKQIGYIANMVDKRSKDEMDIFADLKDMYGDLIMDEYISIRSAIRNSLATTGATWKNAKSGSQRVAAKEMKAACKAIFKRMGLI